MSDVKSITSVEEAEAMIAAEEEKKKAVYLEIGKQYFVKHSTDCEEDFKPFIDELVASSGRIAEINQRIAALKGPTCPNCGTAVNEDSFFCTGCGTRLKETPVIEKPAVPDGVIICTNCGSQMKKDMRFCTVCGTPLVNHTPVDAAATQVYVPETVVEPAPAVMIDPVPIIEPVQEIVKPAQSPEPKKYTAAATPSNICSRCGAVSAPGMNFCVNCGNPVADIPAPVGQDYSVRRCPKCGFISADPNMSFCIECGSPLN